MLHCDMNLLGFDLQLENISGYADDVTMTYKLNQLFRYVARQHQALQDLHTQSDTTTTKPTYTTNPPDSTTQKAMGILHSMNSMLLWSA